MSHIRASAGMHQVFWPSEVWFWSCNVHFDLNHLLFVCLNEIFSMGQYWLVTFLILVDGKEDPWSHGGRWKVLLYRKSGEFLDITGEPKGGKWIFVLSISRMLYVDKKKSKAYLSISAS